MLASTIQVDIDEADELRKMLNYVVDRERLEKVERDLINFVRGSLERYESIILAHINTTNEIYEFIELAGKQFHIGKIRQLLQKTDVQCIELIQQFGHILNYIDTKLTESNGIKFDVISKYENSLVDLQQALNRCEIHKENRKSSNLVRDISVRINSLIEKIKITEKKIPESYTNAINQVATGSDDEDYVDSFENSLDFEDL